MAELISTFADCIEVFKAGMSELISVSVNLIDEFREFFFNSNENKTACSLFSRHFATPVGDLQIEQVISKLPLVDRRLEPSFKRALPSPRNSKTVNSPKLPKQLLVADNKMSEFQPVLSNVKPDVSSMVLVVQSVSSSEKQFQCSFCDYRSPIMNNVKRHIEMKHVPSSTVFQCKTCSATFKLKQVLKRHYMTVHTMPEPAAKAMMSY